MSDDKENVVVRCSPCADLPDPGTPSKKRECSECRTEVWLADSTVEIAAKRYPGHNVVVVCIACRVEGDHQSAAWPEQVELLRAHGDSDRAIAYKLAIAEVAGGARSLEEAEAEILAFPDGLRAKAFPKALERAILLVWSTRRSN